MCVWRVKGKEGGNGADFFRKKKGHHLPVRIGRVEDFVCFTTYQVPPNVAPRFCNGEALWAVPTTPLQVSINAFSEDRGKM